jgi:hypothetical protein
VSLQYGRATSFDGCPTFATSFACDPCSTHHGYRYRPGTGLFEQTWTRTRTQTGGSGLTTGRVRVDRFQPTGYLWSSLITHSPMHVTRQYALPQVSDTSLHPSPTVISHLNPYPSLVTHPPLPSSAPRPMLLSPIPLSQIVTLVTHWKDPLLNVSYRFLQAIVLWVIIGLYIGWAL